MSNNPLANMMNGSNPMQAMLQNNPLMQIINFAKTGGNPMSLMQQMAASNPQFNQIMQMANGKSASDMGQMINNLAKEKNVDVGQLAQQLGMPNEVAEHLGITMPSK